MAPCRLWLRNHCVADRHDFSTRTGSHHYNSTTTCCTMSTCEKIIRTWVRSGVHGRQPRPCCLRQQEEQVARLQEV